MKDYTMEQFSRFILAIHRHREAGYRFKEIDELLQGFLPKRSYRMWNGPRGQAVRAFYGV